MSKYHNVPTVLAGRTFASRAEARRYQALVLAEAAGAIRDLRCQVRYPLIINGVNCGAYVADFVYVEVATGATVVEDNKGFKTQIYILKKKLMKALYGIDIVEVQA